MQKNKQKISLSLQGRVWVGGGGLLILQFSEQHSASMETHL